MTPAKRKLWFEFLRYQKPRFYRHRTIGRFIADFYCARAKLVIEVDGETHSSEQGQVYDEERSAFLQGLRISVIRFNNSEVMQSRVGVANPRVAQIQKAGNAIEIPTLAKDAEALGYDLEIAFVPGQGGERLVTKAP